MAEPLASKLVLRQAHVFTRHGDRSPISRWSPPLVAGAVWTRSDSYSELDTNQTSRPCRPGELTSIGIRQMRDVGGRLRSRYVEEHSLLRSNFDADQIFVRATPYNRTFESAYHLLSALFPSEALLLAPDVVRLDDAPSNAAEPDPHLPHMTASGEPVQVRVEMRVPEAMCPATTARMSGE
eukprot:TRINITY_DN15380_c0_g1_i1.p2 TRINITY_DN15380_c0_g1~~TRINITY_DN15380_c0_g1_i1.p2  ORF type:complete len:181 (+),score=44.29 TRINITY_DN15380_c0_g1_i1:85-627(+)